METQTMVQSPSVFLIKKLKIDKTVAVRLEGFLGQGIKWDAPSSFRLWA
jgi:hypothetical protein